MKAEEANLVSAYMTARKRLDEADRQFKSVQSLRAALQEEYNKLFNQLVTLGGSDVPRVVKVGQEALVIAKNSVFLATMESA